MRQRGRKQFQKILRKELLWLLETSSFTLIQCSKSHGALLCASLVVQLGTNRPQSPRVGVLGWEGRRENHCNQGHRGENGAADKAMQGDIIGTLRGQGWTMTTVCCGDREGLSETRKTRTAEGIQRNGLSGKDTCYVNPSNLSSVSGAHRKVGEESHLYGAASMAPPLITTHMLWCSLPSPVINNWVADELVLGMLRYRL